jgi:hypothetical protein
VALIALVGLLVVAGVWYGIFWLPEGSHLKAAHNQEAQAETKVVSLSAQLAGIRAEQRQLPLYKATLAQLSKAVPEGPALDQLLTTITAAAADAHVSLLSINTPEPAGWGVSGSGAAAPVPTGPPDITLSIAINVANSRQVLAFITALEAQPRLYVVDAFEVQNPTNAPSGKAGKRPTGHSAGPVAGSSALQSISLTVQAFYVSTSSNDPAALNLSFAAPAQPKRGTAKSPSPAASTAQLNAGAKAAATRVLYAEQTYEHATGGYLSSASKDAARDLGDSSLLSASSAPVTPGQVGAVAGNLFRGGWLPVAPPAIGRALLVESLSNSGSCFYIAQFEKGAADVEAYAQTTGGCTSNVVFPTASLGASAHVVASGSGVVSGDWSASW